MPQIKAVIGADARQFNKAMRDAKKNMQMFNDVTKRIGGMMAGYFGTEAIVSFLKTSAEQYDAHVQAESRVATAIQSTGAAAQLTSNQLYEAASALQSITVFDDDEILTSVTTNLLTFTKVSGSVFKDAQKAILDLSTVLKQDLQSSTIQVGKALNDPIAGITALKRVGVSFSEEQKNVIAAMVKTGDVAGAQKLILEELNKEFGGQAEAAAKVGMGAFKQFDNALGDLQEKVGSKFVPMFAALAKSASHFMDVIQERGALEAFGIALAKAMMPASMDGKIDAAANKGKQKKEVTGEDAIKAELNKYAELDKDAKAKLKAGYEKDANTYLEKWKDAKAKGLVEERAHYANLYGLAKDTVAGMIDLDSKEVASKTTAIDTETGLINELEAKIKDLTDARKSANSPKEIMAINDRIDALTSEKNMYESLTGSIRQMNRIQGMSTSDIVGELSDKVTDQNAIALDRRMQPRAVNENPERSLAYAPTFGEQMGAGFSAWKEEMLAVKDITNAVNQSISSAMTSMGVAVGESIAGLINGTASMGDVFTGLLMMLADFMSQLGQALVAAGFASEAFKSLFASPALAIGAGVALIALAGVIKGLLTKGPGGEDVQKFADGGVIFGPTMGLLGEYAGASRNPEVVSPLSTLKNLLGGNDNDVTVYGRLQGENIMISNDRSRYRRGRITGRG